MNEKFTDAVKEAVENREECQPLVGLVQFLQRLSTMVKAQQTDFEWVDTHNCVSFVQDLGFSAEVIDGNLYRVWIGEEYEFWQCDTETD